MQRHLAHQIGNLFQNQPQNRFTRCQELYILQELLALLESKVTSLESLGAETVGYLKHTILKDMHDRLKDCITVFNRTYSRATVEEMHDLVVEMQRIIESVYRYHYITLNSHRNTHRSAIKTATTVSIYALILFGAYTVLPLPILFLPASGYYVAPVVDEQLKSTTGLDDRRTDSVRLVERWRMTLTALIRNLQTHNQLYDAQMARVALAARPDAVFEERPLAIMPRADDDESVAGSVESIDSVEPCRLAEISAELNELRERTKAQSTMLMSMNMARAVCPDEFICPITDEIMNDPVLCSLDGYTYERARILAWLTENRTAPVSRKELEPDILPESVLTENRNIKRAIEKFKAQHADFIYEEDLPVAEAEMTASAAAAAGLEEPHQAFSRPFSK